MQVRVVLRDRALLDVVDLSLRFVAHNWKLYARTALVVIVPAYAITLWIGTNISWLAGWTAAIVVAAFAQAPFTILASKLVFEEGASVRGALATSLRTLPRLTIARFTQAVAMLLGAVMCIFPVFYTAPAVLFLPEVALLEGLGLGAATARAQRLAFAQTGDSITTWLVLLLASVTSIFFLGDYVGRMLLENLFEVTAPETLFTSGGGYTALLGFWLAMPLIATARFFFYLNMRTKIEGWDIQARFLALSLRAREAE